MPTYLDTTPSGYKIDAGRLWSWGYGSAGALGDGTSGVNKSSPVEVATNSIEWKSMSAFYHSLGIKYDGTLWAWGFNNNGQIGDGSTSNKSSPVQIPGTTWSVSSVGHYHSAAIKTDGTLWDWGDNLYGQLGDNSITDKSSPVQELTGGAWQAVGTGRSHTVGIKTDGTLWAWGHNQYGQLGDNTNSVHRSSPVQEILANTNWKMVSCGRWFTTAIQQNGTLWTWGENADGQLGKNDKVHRSSPVQEVTGGTNWKIVSGGYYHTAAVKTDGTLWTWGRGGGGRLGDNTTASKSSPVQEISLGTNWKTVAAAGWHSSAVKTDGTLWSWGENTSGQLADGTQVHRSSPVQELTGGVLWKNVSADGETTVGMIEAQYDITATGLVTQEYLIDVYPSLMSQFKQAGLWGWGDASNGELGDNTQVHRSSPVQTLSGGFDWVSGDTGYGHTSMVKSNGTLWSWGRGGSGQLGDFTQTTKSSPVQETTLTTTWKTVSVGRYHSAAVRTDGTLWAWGFNGNGGLGINSTASRSSPVQEVLAATTWKMVSCGGYFTTAVRTDGTLWAWGYNTTGQLGKNDLTHRSSPVQEVLAATTWKTVSAGGYHAAALRSDGTLWAWGRNTSGQLGKNDVTHRSSPVQELTSGTTWTAVSAGAYHTAAVKTDGTLWTWGDNTEGQLGDNTLTRKSSPVQTISGGTSWKKILGGQNFTAALKTDGTLWAWGHNNYGQLGMGDIVHRSSPTQVPGSSYNWIELVGHGRAYRMLAIRDDSEDTL